LTRCQRNHTKTTLDPAQEERGEIDWPASGEKRASLDVDLPKGAGTSILKRSRGGRTSAERHAVEKPRSERTGARKRAEKQRNEREKEGLLLVEKEECVKLEDPLFAAQEGGEDDSEREAYRRGFLMKGEGACRKRKNEDGRLAKVFVRSAVAEGRGPAPRGIRGTERIPLGRGGFGQPQKKREGMERQVGESEARSATSAFSSSPQGEGARK